MNLRTSELSANLATKQARWKARESRVSSLSSEQKKRLLGAVPPPQVIALVQSIKAAPPMAFAPTFDPEVDWRNRNGNHVTPVKSQGGCGTCVSFASVAVIESMADIENETLVTLSEADSHFCSAHGASCTGWWPDKCLDEAIVRGICDEGCFPYSTAFPNDDPWQGPPRCLTAPDRDQRAVKIQSRQDLIAPIVAKNYITHTGPVTGCLTVYDDFFHYSEGVYHHVEGDAAGGHCVAVIGYSESGQYWLIKNSWDTSWGMGGFANVGYADFTFDGDFFPMYGVQGVQGPAAQP
jgi:C1A family cysteine protease